MVVVLPHRIGLRLPKLDVAAVPEQPDARARDSRLVLCEVDGASPNPGPVGQRSRSRAEEAVQLAAEAVEGGSTHIVVSVGLENVEFGVDSGSEHDKALGWDPFQPDPDEDRPCRRPDSGRVHPEDEKGLVNRLGRAQDHEHQVALQPVEEQRHLDSSQTHHRNWVLRPGLGGCLQRLAGYLDECQRQSSVAALG